MIHMLPSMNWTTSSLCMYMYMYMYIYNDYSILRNSSCGRAVFKHTLLMSTCTLAVNATIYSTYIYLCTLIPRNITSWLQCTSASAAGMSTIPITDKRYVFLRSDVIRYLLPPLRYLKNLATASLLVGIR